MEQQFNGISLKSHRIGNFIWANRVASAAQQGIARYPIYRELRFAARIELEVLLDAIALDPRWRVERLNDEDMLLDGDGLYVMAYGSRKAEYCSVAFYIWSADVARAEEAKAVFLSMAGVTRITEPMFSIDWHFLTATDGLESAAIEELADGPLLDAAYPEIGGGVGKFIQDYLEASETVLVLQGPPGTGKTRLIRAILAAMSTRKGQPARALYTADMRVMKSDEAFVKFITGDHDAFVVEDADHMLKPRADGNEHLHRFLTIADGVVRSQGRKIVFSTNLPNVGDLDEALIRPGRCFARLNIRALTGAEAQDLAVQLAAGDVEKVRQVSSALASAKAKGHSLAEVYQALR